MCRRLLSIIFTIAAVSVAQTPPDRFDSVVIHHLDSGPDDSQIILSEGGKFYANEVTLQMLLLEAYGVKPNQVENAPEWFRTDHWLIEARLKDFSSSLPRRFEIPLLKQLLYDQFSLRAHMQTGTTPALELTVEKVGPYLRATQAPVERQWRVGPGWVKATGITMDILCVRLSTLFGIPVTNATHMDGPYDLWFMLQEPIGPPRRVEWHEVSLALLSYLGLRLQSRSTLVDILVVDEAALPQIPNRQVVPAGRPQQ